MRKYHLKLQLPRNADEERVPLELWDLIAIVLQAGDICAEQRAQQHTHRQSSGRRATIPVYDPEFWSEEVVAIQLSRVLRYFFHQNVDLEFVPMSEERYVDFRFERIAEHIGRPERDARVQVFSPNVDCLAEVTRELHREPSQQVLLALNSHKPRLQPWWDVIDPTGSWRSTGRVHLLHATLTRESDDDRDSDAAYPLVHLLAAGALALALDSTAVCLPQNGIHYLQLPLSLIATATGASNALTPIVTDAVSRLLSKMLDRSFAITNPLIWHTPSQTAQTLLADVEVSNSNSERALWDVLLGRALGDTPERLDRALATHHAAAASGRLDEHEQRELLELFIGTDMDAPVRTFMHKLRELPTLPIQELRQQVRKLPAGRWYGKQEWDEHIRDILLRHAGETSESLADALRQVAGEFIAGTVSFHSIIGQALLPTALEQFHRPTFQPRGEMWVVWFPGKDTIYLRESLGLRYIHYLLQYKRKEMSAVQLRAAIHGNEVVFSRGMEMLDRTTILSYKKYREVLQENLRISNENDQDKRRKWERELAAIDKELRRGTQIGGNSRKVSDLEQARRSISAAIHRSLRTIAEKHEELHAHLRDGLQIGAFLSYDPREEIEWNTHERYVTEPHDAQ